MVMFLVAVAVVLGMAAEGAKVTDPALKTIALGLIMTARGTTIVSTHRNGIGKTATVVFCFYCISFILLLLGVLMIVSNVSGILVA